MPGPKPAHEDASTLNPPAPELLPDVPPLLDLAAAAVWCDANRVAGRRVVLAHGCFDLLHLGHVRYLAAARALGDRLLVTLTPDALVGKGPGRPVFTALERAEMLGAVRCVDAVAINHWPTAAELLVLLRPAVYAKGAEYRDAAADPTTSIGLERAAVESVGGQIAFIDTPKLSSTALLTHLPG